MLVQSLKLAGHDDKTTAYIIDKREFYCYLVSFKHYFRLQKMRLFTRTRELLADHVSWVQYPNVRAVGTSLSIWKNQMPASTRALLVLIGVIVIVASAVALFFLAVLAWATITA